MSTTVLTRAFVIAAFALVGSLVGWSYAQGGIVHLLLDSALTADQKVNALRAYFDRFAAAAPIAYKGMVVVEVVIAPFAIAVIPNLHILAQRSARFSQYRCTGLRRRSPPMSKLGVAFPSSRSLLSAARVGHV